MLAVRRLLADHPEWHWHDRYHAQASFLSVTPPVGPTLGAWVLPRPPSWGVTPKEARPRGRGSCPGGPPQSLSPNRHAPTAQERGESSRSSTCSRVGLYELPFVPRRCN